MVKYKVCGIEWLDPSEYGLLPDTGGLVPRWFDSLCVDANPMDIGEALFLLNWYKTGYSLDGLDKCPTTDFGFCSSVWIEPCSDDDLEWCGLE